MPGEIKLGSVPDLLHVGQLLRMATDVGIVGLTLYRGDLPQGLCKFLARLGGNGLGFLARLGSNGLGFHALLALLGNSCLGFLLVL